MIVEAALLFHVAAFLCDTPQTAILFEDMISAQRNEALAADDLARQAGRQVCGYYAGQAAVGAQRVFDAGGGGSARDL